MEKRASRRCEQADARQRRFILASWTPSSRTREDGVGGGGVDAVGEAEASGEDTSTKVAVMTINRA